MARKKDLYQKATNAVSAPLNNYAAQAAKNRTRQQAAKNIMRQKATSVASSPLKSTVRKAGATENAALNANSNYLSGRRSALNQGQKTLKAKTAYIQSLAKGRTRYEGMSGGASGAARGASHTANTRGSVRVAANNAGGMARESGFPVTNAVARTAYGSRGRTEKATYNASRDYDFWNPSASKKSKKRK